MDLFDAHGHIYAAHYIMNQGIRPNRCGSPWNGGVLQPFTSEIPSRRVLSTGNWRRRKGWLRAVVGSDRLCLIHARDEYWTLGARLNRSWRVEALRKDGSQLGKEDGENHARPQSIPARAEMLCRLVKIKIDIFMQWCIELWKLRLREFHRQTCLHILTALGASVVLHISLNTWAVPRLNKSLPQVSKSLKKIVSRDISVKTVKWIAPTGILGFHPLGRVSGVSIGQGGVEKSHAHLDTVDVYINPIKSILYGRLMLSVKGDVVDLHVKQADNFSWFGFPDDTVPSSRFGGRGGSSKRKAPPPKPRFPSSTVAKCSISAVKDVSMSTIFSEFSNSMVDWHRTRTASLESNLGNSYNNIFICSVDRSKRHSDRLSFSGNEASRIDDQSCQVGYESMTTGKLLDSRLESLSVDLYNLYSLSPKVEKGDAMHRDERTVCMHQDSFDYALQSKVNKSAIGALNNFSVVHEPLDSLLSDQMRQVESFKKFSELVEDPGMLKKKCLGSKALQQARNWKPAIKKQNTVERFTLPEPEISKNKNHAKAFVSEEVQPSQGRIPTSIGKGSRKLMDYSNPSYTPAPPGVVAERLSRKSILTVMLERLSAMLVKRISLESFVCEHCTLFGYIYDEPVPRVFRNVLVKAFFSKDFNKLKVDIKAEPEKRALESYRWTMKEGAIHHLRNHIGSDYYSEMGSPLATDDDPSGGKLEVRIQADNIINNDMDSFGPVFPYMRIAIHGQNLHAPLIERIVELPMDIKKGRLDGHIVISSEDGESWMFPKFNGRVAVKDADFHFWDSSDEIIDSTMDLIFEGDRVYLHKAKGYFGAIPLKVTGDLDLNPLHGEYRVSASVSDVEINALRATLGIRPTPFSVTGSIYGTMHVTGPLEKPIFSGHAHVARPTEGTFCHCEQSPALKTLLATGEAVGAYDKVPFQDAGAVFSLDTSTNEMTLHAIHAELFDGGQLQGSGKMNVAPSAELDPNALHVNVRAIDINQEAIAKRYFPDIALPAEIDSGLSSGNFSMKGAHLSPVIDANFSISDGTCGYLRLQRDSTTMKIQSPHFEAVGSVYLHPPSYGAMKKAITQTQAFELAKPNFTGGTINLNLNGLDIIPFLSDDDSVRNLSKNAGEPVRLKVNGRVKLEGDVQNTVNSKLLNDKFFIGSMNLENIRFNQMKLYRDLKGTVELTNEKISVHGKGMRPDETLDVEINLQSIMNQLDMGSGPSKFGESYLNLRCGRLQASGSVMENGSLMDFRVANIKLDDLEFASLRGELQEISCDINFSTQTGRGRASILAPKYTGLQGENLSGGFRWEKDVFRLEKFVLQQKESRYEVQGEYVLPSSFKLPSSTADLFNPGDLDDSLEKNGRWRIRVDAPYAEIQDLTPLARLLQSVNNQFPADYEKAKSAFIRSLTAFSMRLNDLNESVLLSSLTSGKKGIQSDPRKPDIQLQFPALQTCQGFWKGSIQAFGGGDGATSCDFDLRGHNWMWGNATLDSFIARGNGHSEDGVQLQEFVLNAGDAKLLVRGSFFNENQDATMLLTDFPVSSLQPVFQAIPALQHASPAVSAQAPDPIASPLPLGIIASTVNRIQGTDHGETNSPISGQLFMSGSLGGSKSSPIGDVTVRVYDAVVGPTRLSNAQASAKIDDGKDLLFDVNIVPIDGQRSSGQIVASGKLPIESILETEQIQKKEQVNINIDLNVRDGGMAVLTSLSPNVRWKQGIAELTANISGSINKPIVTGKALISKALLEFPVLKYPLNLVSADIHCEDDTVVVKGIDAYVGRKGRIRLRGTLPLRHENVDKLIKSPRLSLDLHKLEVKARNLYTGQVDALLTARDSFERPVIGGSLRFSKGSLFLNPQAQEGNASADTFEDTRAPNSSLAPSVSKVFSLLTKGDSDLATQFESAIQSEMEAMEVIVEDSGGSNAVLDGLAVQFGPDLRALYPLVMNFGVSGELVASGPAHPESIEISGALKLPSGEINLLAAQFELDREHENMILFVPSGEGNRSSSGIDPLVDVALSSGDLKVSINGKASEWSEHLMMQSIRRGGSGMDAGEKLDTLEAARLLESKLKAALLAEDGQIALNKLAGSTMATFMPKIETQGSVGNTKWRLVSAPSVPGLLDPGSETSASNVLDFLALGAEVEVTFGQKLQAAMVRKLRESDIMTKWTLNYNLNSKLRMQFDISSVPPYPKTLTFQYSSEDNK